MNTFDEAITNFTEPGAAPLAEMKQTFAPTLRALRDLKRTFPKEKATWQTRLERIWTRYHAAQSRGIFRSSVASRLEELGGGRVLHGGLIAATERQIDVAIDKIERLSGQDLQQRRWRSWPGEPQKIRDNMAEIGTLLAQLEDIIKDGGELEGLIRQRSGQPATALASPQRDSTTITVET